MMDTPLWQLKEQMCEIGRRIWQRGFCAGNEGNHSARIGEDRVLCTPTGISKGFLSPQDMCLVDMDGQQVEPNPVGRRRTSEVLLHLAIYRKRSDIGAVVHSHPPHATAFAIAEVPVPEGIHPEAEVFLGKVRTAPFAMPATPALPDSITPLIGPETNSILLGNHGTVSFSRDLIDAYYKLEILDAYCRILLLCTQLGRVNMLNRDQLTQLLDIKKGFGMDDERSACAPEGCIGTDNEPYLATLDVRPATATCASGGGRARTGSCACAGDGAGEDAMVESLVAAITDQIMAGGGREKREE